MGIDQSENGTVKLTYGTVFQSNTASWDSYTQTRLKVNIHDIAKLRGESLSLDLKSGTIMQSNTASGTRLKMETADTWARFRSNNHDTAKSADFWVRFRLKNHDTANSVDKEMSLELKSGQRMDKYEKMEVKYHSYTLTLQRLTVSHHSSKKYKLALNIITSQQL